MAKLLRVLAKSSFSTFFSRFICKDFSKYSRALSIYPLVLQTNPILLYEMATATLSGINSSLIFLDYSKYLNAYCSCYFVK